MEQQKLDEQLLRLQGRLRDVEQSLSSIKYGQVDSIVVESPKGNQIYTLVGPDHPYMYFLDTIAQGALTLDKEGMILYCNRKFYTSIGKGSSELIGRSFYDYVAHDSKVIAKDAFHQNSTGSINIFMANYLGDRPLKYSIQFQKSIWDSLDVIMLVLTEV